MLKIFKANIAYAIGSAASSAALFLLVPYLINSLSPDEYGAWALFEIGILFLAMLMVSGMDVGLMREYWFLESEGERRRLSGTIFITMLLWGGFITSAGLMVLWFLRRNLLTEAWQFDLALSSLILVFLIGFMEAIFGLLLSLLRIREEAIRFVVLSVGRMLLFLLGSITGVQLGYGVNGALAGRLIAGVVGVALAIGMIKNYLAFVFERDYFYRVIRYGLPLLPTSFASYLLLASDRYILNLFHTLEVVAIYSFMYKVATSLEILVTRPFALDWAPRRFKIATQPNPGQKYAQALLIYCFIAIGFALLILATVLAVYVWFVPSIYWSGITHLPIILAAYVVFGLSYPLNVGIMLKDRTYFLPYISWLSAGVCLLLNFWWIPQYGMAGAAWATLVSYILWTGSITVISLKLYPIDYPRGSLLAILLGAALSYGGIIMIDQWWMTIDQWSSVKMLLIGLLIKGSWVLLIMGAVGYLLWGENLKQFIKQKQT